MQVDWELSQTLASLDGQGVRAACVLPAAAAATTASDDAKAADADDTDNVDAFTLVAGTQGGGLVAFGVPSGRLTPVAYQHNHAVTALLAASSGQFYVTGCKDAVIRIFDATTHELQASLTGHEKPVTSLAWCKAAGSSDADEYLISGSWDGTAKVWHVPRRALVATLPDHENSVCCVGLEPSADGDLLRMATGSAGVAQNNVISGHTVRLWSADPRTGQTTKLAQVANDHEGPIRGIAVAPPTGTAARLLATCSNDGTVKLRSPDTARCEATLGFMTEQQQHPPMLLGVTCIDETFVAACAEDGHVVLWDVAAGESDSSGTGSSGAKPPQSIVHATCVWNICDLPNGDLATCSDDGMVRIFTRSTERMAPAAERETFVETVLAARQKAASGAGPSAEEVARLPRWETNLQQQGTSEGQVHLFQKDGVAIAAQWSMASQTWIEVGQVMGSPNDGSGGAGNTIDGVSYDHVLPIEVDQTGGGVANLQIGYNNGENPFVAAQRFIDAHVLPQHHLSEIADYIQQRVGRGAGPTLGGPPAAAATAPSATTGVPIVSFQYFPAAAHKSFDLSDKSAKTTLEKIKTKIHENNGNDNKLSAEQLGQLDSLLQTLAATNRYHASKVSAAELSVLVYMLQNLSPQDAFPALDLARMVVLHPDATTREKTHVWNQLIQQAVTLCEQSFSTPLHGPAAVAVPMLSLRLWANAFKGGPGAVAAVTSLLQPVLVCTERLVASSNKNVRLSVATVVHNVGLYLYQNSSNNVAAQSLVGVANQVIAVSAKSYEGEALMRTLLGLGTTVMKSPEAKTAAQTLYLASKVEPAASPHGSVVKAAAKEVYALLQ